MKKFICLFALLFLFACSAAKEEKSPMQMDPAEMQAQMQKYSTPGEEHKNLQNLVGKWKATSKFWMDPSKEPEVSTAEVKRDWILDGRFVQEEYKDKNEKSPFHGIGLLGYDNVQQTYVSNWVDTMGTGIASSNGIASPDGKTLSFVGSQSCPMTGSILKNRSKLSIISKDKNVYEMFQTNVEGEESKILEITYERQG